MRVPWMIVTIIAATSLKHLGNVGDAGASDEVIAA